MTIVITFLIYKYSALVLMLHMLLFDYQHLNKGNKMQLSYFSTSKWIAEFIWNERAIILVEFFKFLPKKNADFFMKSAFFKY